MSEHDWLAERFEENRPHLRAVAYRMLGSSTEADDAVQETWLRLSRAGTSGVENLGGWLTTIVARVALNMLRSRTLRREEPMDPPATVQPVTSPANGTDPEHQAVVAAAFPAASREGNFDALLTMLDPDMVLRADTAAAQMGADAEAIGARPVAGIFSGRAKALRPALIDGAPGAVWTLRGETRVVFAFTIADGTITAIEQIADLERIARLEVTPLKAGLKTRQAQRGPVAGRN